MSLRPLPDADQARLFEVLVRRFGVAPAHVAQVQGGWSAKAFRVDTGDKRYFLKEYDRTQRSVLPWIDRIDSYIYVQGYLAKTPRLRGRMVAPVCAPQGEYKIQEGDRVYLLFDYEEGATVGFGKLNALQMRELAQILAELHEFGEEIPCDMSGLAEDISLWFCDELRAFLKSGHKGGPGVAMRRHGQIWEAAVDETLRLKKTVRLSAPKLCLCHTDAHGNNVMKGERLVLADWEGLCVAPPEADLFMYARDPLRSVFFGAYCDARAGFVLDADMLRFYLLRRQVEDAWADVLRLVNDHPDEGETRELYRQLQACAENAEALLSAAPPVDKIRRPTDAG